PIFQNSASAVTGNFDSPSKPRPCRSSCFQDSKCTSGHDKVCHCRIFDFNPFVRQSSCACMQFLRHSQQILQQIHRMNSLVHQRSATIQLPCSTPAPFIVIFLTPPPFDV